MKKRTFARPILYISKCLGFDSCRFNGQVIHSEFVDMLHQHAHIALVCPEVEIGLGVPRHPIRFVQTEQGLRLQQLQTERDVTDDMQAFMDRFFSAVGAVDGFILKGKSPSCGINPEAKVYPSLEKVSALGTEPGMFGGAVKGRYAGLAVEDEGRLTNYSIREHFLTRVYLSAEFRKTKSEGTMGALVDFQGRHKYLLMAYNQEVMRKMGRVVANHDSLPVETVYEAYEPLLLEAFAQQPGYTSWINVLQHVMGHFSDFITAQEKAFILDNIEMYREERVPLSVPLHLLRSYAVRGEDEYLMNQAFFEPFPSELVLITDSGKGRKTK